MDTNLITAMSGVLGSIVGASATIATTWITQRTVGRRELAQQESRKREALYGEFIVECSKLLMDALTHTMDKPETLVPVYAMLNRIRLTASPAVLREAEKLVTRITDQYFAENLTVEQMRAMARADDADPLKAFGEACRSEFEEIRAML